MSYWTYRLGCCYRNSVRVWIAGQTDVSSKNKEVDSRTESFIAHLVEKLTLELEFMGLSEGHDFSQTASSASSVSSPLLKLCIFKFIDLMKS